MLSIRLLAVGLLALVVATPVAAQNPQPGVVAFSDSFDDVPSANFPVSSLEPLLHSQRYVDGEYEIVRRAGGSFFETVPGIYSSSTIAVDVRLSDGPDNARAFVTCRRDARESFAVEAYFRPTVSRSASSQPSSVTHPQRGYLFNLVPGRVETAGVANNPGFVGPRFQLIKLENGYEMTLLDQGPAPEIRDKGEIDRIELTCVESTIKGSINGVEVFSILDSTWQSGRNGFGMAGVNANARFDNLVVTYR
jgi:hypothetical protein